MTYTPCTTWANGVHPLTKTAKPKRTRKPNKPRRDAASYKQITAHDVTLYLSENPGSTSVDLGKVLGGSNFNVCRMLKWLSLSRAITRHRETVNGIWKYTVNKIAPVNPNYVVDILGCIGRNPGCTAEKVRQHTGLIDIFTKLKILRKRGDITALQKMTPNYGKPLNHYFLKELS